MMILVGVEHDDTADDVEWLVKKTLGLRIFDDDAGVMNRSVLDVGGEILAARPETAVPLYRDFIDRLNEALPKPCGEGEFGADMQVALVNDGPVTIIIDSHLKE